MENVFFLGEEDGPPKYCIKCGAAYPWQQVQDLEDVLPDILHDTPKTQSASLKLKRLLPKLGTVAYDIAIKVITDVASETAKKTMNLN
jgi:hypothetical protein